jgi:uncharacterized membrane protein
MNIQTKQQFMKELKKSLQYTFSQEETVDILSDYDGFFDYGEEEGKSEAQICAELGNPRDIAIELTNNPNARKRRINLPNVPVTFYAHWGKILILAALVLVTGTTAYILTTLVWAFDSGVGISYISVKNTVAGIVFFLMSVTFIGLFMRGFGKSMITRNKKVKPLFVLCHLLVSVSAIAVPLFYLWVFGKVNDLLVDNVSYDLTGWVGLVINHIGILFISMPIVIAMASVVCYFYFGKQWFTVIIHAFGAVICNALPLIVFDNLSDSIITTSMFNFDLVVIYLVSVAVTLTASCMIKAKEVH